MRAFMRLFFRLLYNEFSFTYDWVACIVSLGSWKSWVLSTLEHVPGPRVLELGFGPGHLQRALKARQRQLAGLDNSPWMARRLKRTASTLDLVLGQAQALPFANAWFDQVVATFPTEYIADPLTLREGWRVLRPGGSLVILAYARPSGDGLQARAVNWLFRVTGQAAVDSVMQDQLDKFTEILSNQGFGVNTGWKILDRSEVFIIRGWKSPEENTIPLLAGLQ